MPSAAEWPAPWPIDCAETCIIPQPVTHDGRQHRRNVAAAIPEAWRGADEESRLIRTIRRSLPRPERPLGQSGLASLDIYDVRGRFVINLAQGRFSAGEHKSLWDGTDASGAVAASGIYYCRLQAPLVQKSIKMVLLR